MTILTAHGRPRFMLSLLSATVLTATLTGCLSSSGSSSSDTAPPPQTETPANPLVVATAQGDVQGIEEGNMRIFRKIPYAAAPVGERRFAPPEPAPARSARLELGKEFGDQCPQGYENGSFDGSEDCLYLNVYAPAEGENLPVMVWIHGGAFLLGNGGGEYDPTRLVAEDVIVVTLNYRLGALGFLAHAGLESDSGNFGLMDQQAAIKWVKENIAGFGGDADNMTLFGESAGGHSVLSHIVSPQTQGLFQRAIIQSGSYAPTQLPKQIAQTIGTAVAAGVGCADPATVAQCLREVDTATLLAAQEAAPWPVPVVDPEGILPKSISEALNDGDFDRDLDIMIGNNQDEGTLFVALDEFEFGPLEALGEQEYRNRVAELLANTPYDHTAVADRYLAAHAQSDNPLSLALSAIWTDYMFACNSDTHASQFANEGLATYSYWFTDKDAPFTMVPPALVSYPLGATHAGEIPYVLYPETTMTQRYTGTEEDLQTLSTAMVKYWTRFAKVGDPNSDDGVDVWPEYGSGKNLRVLNPQLTNITSAVHNDYHQCTAWRTGQF